LPRADGVTGERARAGERSGARSNGADADT
jgi:hypothetical protein